MNGGETTYQGDWIDWTPARPYRVASEHELARTCQKDLLLLINELGSIRAAIRYCERIEAVNGPLASVYANYAERLRALVTA